MAEGKKRKGTGARRGRLDTGQILFYTPKLAQVTAKAEVKICKEKWREHEEVDMAGVGNSNCAGPATAVAIKGRVDNISR